MLILNYKRQVEDNRFGRKRVFTKYVMRKGNFQIEHQFTPEIMEERHLVARRLREMRQELNAAVRGAHGNC